MTEIHATAIAWFRKDTWQVMRVTKPGISQVSTKTGDVDVPFNPGDVILADTAGHVIVAPISMEGALHIARTVLDGDIRSSTDSHSLRALATAVIGFQPAPEPDVPEPVALEMAVHHD